MTTPADPAALPLDFDGLVLGSEAADAAAWREEPDRAQRAGRDVDVKSRELIESRTDLGTLNGWFRRAITGP